MYKQYTLVNKQFYSWDCRILFMKKIVFLNENYFKFMYLNCFVFMITMNRFDNLPNFYYFNL